MTTAMMTNRLLWKEFRVLRLVWLMCVSGVAALMLLVTVISESQSHPMDYAPALWGFAIWVPPVYILAALATMFAGEREEGTLVWLSVLAPSSGRLMVTKLLYVIATGAMLQGSLAVVAALLSQFDGNDRADGVLENLFVMSFLLVESVVWGWFWSLQTSKPLNAILYAAISLIAVNLGSIVITEELGYRYSANWNGPWGNALGFWGWGRLILYTVVVSVSAQVCDRWLAGRPWDWGFVVRWWAAKRTTKTQDIAALEPREPWQREWQRLRWLEWQALRPFAWMIGAAALIAAVSLLFGEHPTPAAAFIFCWLAPLVAGLMSWQGEQSQAQYRTLGLRGASSTALWWNKLAMWALAALAGAAFISLSNACCWHLLWFVSGGTRWSSVIRDLTHTPQPYRSTGEIFGSILSILAYGATQYALAFTCAHLMKKTVVALGSTLIGTLVLTIWFYTCLGYGLPLWYFLAPIPLWLLWISASYLPAWWVENSTWHVSRQRGGELALLTVFPVGLLSLAAGYRIWEVPYVDTSTLQFDSAPATNTALTVNINAWNHVADLVEGLRGQPELIVNDATLDGTEMAKLDLDPWIAANREGLKALRDKVLGEMGMYSQSAIWRRVQGSRFHNWQLPVDALAKLAIEELAAGRPEESVEWLRASFRLFGVRQSYADLQTSYMLTRSDEEWRGLVYDWAQHPRQAVETLKLGLNAAASELRFSKCEAGTLLTQYEVERHTPSFWPWEVARHERVVAVAAINRWTYLHEIRAGVRLPSHAPSEYRDSWIYLNGRWELPNRAAWEFRDSDDHWQYPFTGPYFCRVEGLDPFTTTFMQELESRMRATITVMSIVGYRRLHGELPATLGPLESFFDPQHRSVLKDIWTGRGFGYDPRAMDLGTYPPGATFESPFLWTAGSRQIESRDQVVAELRPRTSRDDSLRSGVRVYRIPPPADAETSQPMK